MNNMEHRVEMLSDGTKKFFITEGGEEREVNSKEYIEFNKSKEMEEEALKKRAEQLREELQSDLKNFISDINRIGVTMKDVPGSDTALIDSNSLTNFLLWKMLKGKI